MGKIRAKKRAAMSRAQPAGLPSPEEVKQATGETSTNTRPVLQRLSDPDSIERKWACQSLSHLVLDHAHLTELMEGRVVRRLTPLLQDEFMEIREAAAGALRNMSGVDDPAVHQYMAGEDVMTPASALIRDAVTRLDVAMETEGAKKDKVTADREVLLRTMEEVLCLLWNLSETSSLVVEVFNRDNLLPFVLQLLQPARYPPSLCVAAAQLLHVITEDNQDAIRLVASSTSYLTHLEGILAHPLPEDYCGCGRMLIVRAAVAGVFQHLLPSLPETVWADTLQGVLRILGYVLDVETTPLLAGSHDNPSESGSQMSAVRLILSAKELACEVLGNLCYTEGEGDSEDEWEECEDVEEVEGAEMMEDLETSAGSQVLPALHMISEAGLHTKVFSLLQWACSVFDTCPKQLSLRLSSLLSTTLLTLQNLVSSLSPDSWSDHMTVMWSFLFTLPANYSDPMFPVVGLLTAILSKLDNSRSHDFLKEEQLHKLCEVGVHAGEVGVRADVVRLLGLAARLALRDVPTSTPLLNIIGTALRGCVEKDPSLWVVCQALDSVFDMFGSDSCPPDLFTSLSLLPVLRQAAASFTARLRVEKRSLSPQMSLVKSAKVNLPRFITYMTSK